MEQELKIAIIAGAALFLGMMDAALLSTIIAPLAHHFNVIESAMSSPVLWYTVGSCLFIPLVSWISKIFCKKRLLFYSIFFFLLASIACGLSNDIIIFSVFRFIQGCAISIASPIAIIMLMECCDEKSIVIYVGLINMPGMLGASIGPFIGGAFTNYISWRYAFFFNIPICFFLLAFIIYGIETSKESLIKERKPFDLLGFLMLSGSITFVAIGVDLISSRDSLFPIIFLITGIGLLVLYFVFYRCPQPILSPLTFHDRFFLMGTVVNCITRIGMAGMPVAISLFLQSHPNISVMETGFCIGLLGASGAFAKLFSGLVRRAGLQISMFFGILSTALCMYLSQYLTVHIFSFFNITILLFLGFSMSILYTAMNSVMLITVGKKIMSDACNIQSIIQQLFNGFGIVFALFLFSHLKENAGGVLLAYQYFCQIGASIVLFAIGGILFFTDRAPISDSE